MSAAARAAAPVSSMATICSTVMRPLANVSPPRNTVGTAITWRCSASSLNTAPSMATWLMFGFSTLMTFSACTTSGQFWHDEREERLEVVGALDRPDLLGDLVADARRMTADVEERQHERRELVAERDAGEA